MPDGSFQQANNRTAIKKVVDLIDYVIGNVCVVLMQEVVLPRDYLHGFRRLVVLLHIVGSVFGVHRQS